MVLSRSFSLAKKCVLLRTGVLKNALEVFTRHSTEFRSGALKPKPEQMPFGLVVSVVAVVPGLFIGAAISKTVANFLEENDLFVPSDDDDDED